MKFFEKFKVLKMSAKQTEAPAPPPWINVSIVTVFAGGTLRYYVSGETISINNTGHLHLVLIGHGSVGFAPGYWQEVRVYRLSLKMAEILYNREINRKWDEIVEDGRVGGFEK